MVSLIALDALDPLAKRVPRAGLLQNANPRKDPSPYIQAAFTTNRLNGADPGIAEVRQIAVRGGGNPGAGLLPDLKVMRPGMLMLTTLTRLMQGLPRRSC